MSMRLLLWVELIGCWVACRRIPSFFARRINSSAHPLRSRGQPASGCCWNVPRSFWRSRSGCCVWPICRRLARGCFADLRPIAVALAWTSVTHLGKQFRIHAGLYHDHALVKTGPYAIVRHPIYASLLAALLCTLLLLTRWQWIAISLALFICGTEIRVRSEEQLLAERFGAEFEAYGKTVPRVYTVRAIGLDDRPLIMVHLVP